MKIRTQLGVSGSAMVITLLTAAIIGVSMGSYLVLVSNQSRSVMRALAWNACIPVLEAGIEEALSQVHYKRVTELSANGWELGADGLYHKSRAIGNDGSYCEVTIQPVVPPVIVSSGYVPAPLSPASQLGIILGGANATDPAKYVKRKVRVTTVPRPTIPPFVMLARAKIKLNGNGIETDSFDSTKPELSTNGKYDPAKTSDKGDVGTNGELTDYLSTGNADIKGTLRTGYNGSTYVGKNGSVGDSTWVDSGKLGIQDGHYFNDMNYDIFDAETFMPSGTPIPAYPGTYPVISPTGAVTNYNYFLAGSPTEEPLFFKTSSLGGKVYVKGNVALWVTDYFSFSSKDVIYIEPGSSLQVFVGAPSASIGSGAVNAGSALSFQYYGLKSNTSVALGGNAAFTGTIYAPYATFTMSGGGSSVYDFVGAVVAKFINVNGHFKFHFDEALLRDQFRGYVMNSWNEIDPYSP